MTTDTESRIVELLEQKIERRNVATWERHITTGMVTLLLAAVTGGAAWVSDEIGESRQSQNAVLAAQAETNSEVKLLKFQVQQLRNEVTIAAKAIVTRSEFQIHVQEVERRLQRLEVHVREDEQGWKSGARRGNRDTP